MDDSQAEFLSRLSRIDTQWTVIREAHQTGDHQDAAQTQLVECYRTAIFRYLLVLTKDGDLAEELFQEFVVRMLSGQFKHADPQKGRFRSYLKSSLIRLVQEYHRKAKRRGAVVRFAEEVPEAEARDQLLPEFDTAWRDELLRQAWSDLELAQRSTGKPYHGVLQLRAMHRDASSEDLAQLLNRQLAERDDGANYNASSVRKLLQRSREKFATRLLDLISAAIGSNDLDLVENELITLGLHSYCQQTIKRKRESV